MKRIAWYILLFGMTISVVSAQDSIPATDLKEVIVESDRSWVENGVYNFIPTKKEKQLANSPGTLINVMNLPILRGNREGITTTSNEPVSIFINGNPATQIDIATFLPKDVMKVEYLKDPSDPKFRGAKNVVNFILMEYEVGGVTRAEVRQTIPDHGFYLLGSKLSYKDMTYGVRFMGRYDKGKVDSENEDRYHGIWYDNSYYDEIMRNYSEHSRSELRNFEISANAVYANKKGFQATHTVALGIQREPYDTGEGLNSWPANLFGSEFSAYSGSSRKVSPSISGDYYGNLSSKLSLSGYWQYAHSENRSNYWSQFGIDDRIYNDSREKIESANARLELSYSVTPKWRLDLSANPQLRWYSTSYSGSATDKQRQFREETEVALGIWFNPNSNISFRVAPGFVQTHYKVGEDTFNEIRPDITFSGNWNPNRKLFLDFSLRAFRFGASASASNPILIRTNELEWVTGNPDLKNTARWWAQLNLYYQPIRKMSFSASVSYSRVKNAFYTFYSAAPQELGGIIRSTLNAPDMDDLTGYMAISAYPVKGVSLFLLPALTYQYFRGPYAGGHLTGSVNGSVAYTLRNVRFELAYNPGQRVYGGAGNTYYRKSDSFSFEVTYGISDWNVACGISDIFHSKRTDTHKDLSGVFDSYRVSTQRGREVYVNLSYTIGYGKKINPNINLEGAANVESSVVR